MEFVNYFLLQILKHELQLRTWRNKLKSKVASDGKFISPEQSSSDATFVNANIEFDISILPEKAILRVCMNSLYIIYNNLAIYV
jgi:hypothetical protein